MIELGSGAMIVEVVPDGPADQAGLEKGDLLVSVEGKEIGVDGDLAAMIAQYQPGDTITVEVADFGPRLDRESREVVVTLAEHPEAKGKAYLGVTFAPMTGGEMFGPGGEGLWFHEFDGDGPCDNCEDHDDDRDSRFERWFEFRRPRR
jgi:hypothetical protein